MFIVISIQCSISVLMICYAMLCYVTVTTVGPLDRNVVHRMMLAIFCSIFKFCWVLLSFLTVCHGIRDVTGLAWRDCCVPEAERRPTV